MNDTTCRCGTEHERLYGERAARHERAMLAERLEREAEENEDENDEDEKCPECVRSNGPWYSGPCEH